MVRRAYGARDAGGARIGRVQTKRNLGIFAAAFLIAAILLAGAACALCLAQGDGIAESVEQTLGDAVKTLNAAKTLGESMDEKTAATVVAAADIILDTLTPLKRLAFSVLLRGVFALPLA